MAICLPMAGEEGPRGGQGAARTHPSPGSAPCLALGLCLAGLGKPPVNVIFFFPNDGFSCSGGPTTTGSCPTPQPCPTAGAQPVGFGRVQDGVRRWLSPPVPSEQWLVPPQTVCGEQQVHPTGHTGLVAA